MLRIYYTDLIELTATLVFLIVFKIVLLIGMRKMSTMLSDEPPVVKAMPTVSMPFQVIRYALTTLLIMDGVWQIPPLMLNVTTASLVASGSTSWVAHWWVSNALWLNIWSVVIELSLAGLLISFKHPIAVRITASLIGAYGLLIWSTVQGFGHVGAPSPTFLAQSPGTGILMVLTSIPLILQRLPWRKYFRIAIGSYWVLFCLSLWWPASRFWTGQGYEVFKHIHPVTPPGELGTMFSGMVSFFSANALATTLILGIVTLALGISWFVKTTRWLLVMTAVALTAVWVLPEGLGFGGAYAFAAGAAPVVATWVLMSWLGKRVGRES